MRGQKTTEMELEVPVAEVWELYGSLNLARLMEERLPMLVNKISVDGDGDVGTILHIHLTPGLPFSSYKEKVILLDNENHVRMVEIVEGGFLTLGFSLFRIRYEITEKNQETSIIRAITEYEIGEEFAAIAPPVSNDTTELIAQAAATYLLQKKFEASLRNAPPVDDDDSDSDEDVLSISFEAEETNDSARSAPPTAEETERSGKSPTARPPAEEINGDVRSVRPQPASATTK